MLALASMSKVLLLLVYATVLLQGVAYGDEFKETFKYANEVEELSISQADASKPGGSKLRRIIAARKVEIPQLSQPMKFAFSVMEENVRGVYLPAFLDNRRDEIDWFFKGLGLFGGNHFKKTTLRIDQQDPFSSFFLGHNISFNVDFYPINNEEVRRSIDLVLSEAKLKSLDFVKSKQFGFYFKSSSDITESNVTCEGKLTVAINATEDYTEIHPLYQPELHWLRQGANNGLLFNLPSLECSYLEDSKVVTTSYGLTFIWQQQFPYLFLRLSEETNPLNMSLANYHVKVDQTTHEKTHFTPETAYNTSIVVGSKSIFPLLNFQLDETIVNYNSSQGVEEALFTDSEGKLTVVEFGSWKESSIGKLVSSALGLFNDGNSNGPFYHFKYIDRAQEDYVHFNFALKKSLISWIKANLSRLG